MFRAMSSGSSPGSAKRTRAIDRGDPFAERPAGRLEGVFPCGDVMAEPVDDRLFAELMATFEPFERKPLLAVAVSGGGDSMALCLLADAWARRRGGSVVALTVDHGLRPESGAEGETVGGWMATRGIDHHVLSWRGSKPRSAIQATARAARYDLLAGWCRQAGVLHLLLGHQLEDQTETFLMRLNRGSGVDGLASMASVTEGAGVRLLRPLLGVPRDRLQATLTRRGQGWLDDPSNRNAVFGRVRIRQSLPAFAEEGFTPARLGRFVRDFGRNRREREADIARLLGRACTVFPAGYAVVDGAVLVAASVDEAAGAVARVLATVGGGAYPPAKTKVESLLPWFAGQGSAPSVTLARCRCLRQDGGIVVCRESRRLPAPSALMAGGRILWDDRFALVIAAGAAPIGSEVPEWTVAPLGREGWAEIVAEAPELRERSIPYPVRLTLPAIRDSAGVCEVPFLDFRRAAPPVMGRIIEKALFSPRNALSGLGFCLAPEVSSTIS